MLYNNAFNDLCNKLCVSINFAKDKTHNINDFLGIELDTILMEARPPQEKLTKVMKLMETALGKKFISMENLQSLVQSEQRKKATILHAFNFYETSVSGHRISDNCSQ